MSFERPYVTTYYDSEANVQFRDALIDAVIVPAVFAASYKDIAAGLLTGDVMAECETTDTGGEDYRYRTSYDFFAEQDDGMIVITSTEYERLRDLDDPAVLLLHDEVQTSLITDEVKERYRDNLEALRTKAIIETFTRRSFYIRKINDSNQVRVRTDLGYSIDQLDVDYFTDDMPLPELDRERETVFEVAEIVEIVQALLSLELITESHAKEFIDREF
ncbi:MAG: hypothetical protein JWP06_125 [Candidatus Saccharibacteria bacterium]|nr:hypothetical protein [Candidatus Saccharibacteria bacterium]